MGSVDEPKPRAGNAHRTAQITWNDPERIAYHRSLTPSERVRLAIEASRAALMFANGRRVDDR